MTLKRIGIDVGGTNVKIALVNDEGKILYSNSVPTRAEMGYEYTVNNIKQAIYDLLKETKLEPKDIQGIGFGFPGQVDYKAGIVRNAPNIPGWVEIPIAKIFEDEFHIPTRVDNDVRCAALGELNYGAGKGCENLICITVGTGIGSGKRNSAGGARADVFSFWWGCGKQLSSAGSFGQSGFAGL